MPELASTVADELLKVHRSYLRPIRQLIEAGVLKGAAHITGGGLIGNVPRVLPPGCRARIYKSSWPVPAVFEALRRAGNVEDAEMFQTFNMGVGYVVIVPAAAAETAARLLREAGEQVVRLGEVVAGERGVELVA